MSIKGEKTLNINLKHLAPVILSYGQSFHDLRHLYSDIQAHKSKLPNSGFKQLTEKRTQMYL